MKKQIIAVTLVVVMVALAFTACSKGYYVYKDSDGVEHPVLTNKEGATILNDFGQIVIGVTGADGKLVTKTGGEYETAAIEFPSSISNGNIYETTDLIITLPEKEWTVESDQFKKKDSKITVTANYFTTENYASINDLLDAANSTMGKLKDTLGARFTYEYATLTLDNGVVLYRYDANFFNEDGTLNEHRIQYYFKVNDHFYSFLGVIPAAEDGTVDLNYIFTSMIKFK